MDFAIDLIQEIPAGWPRLATLAAIIAAYFFFPDIVKKLRGVQKEKETLERLTQFLQVKKLLLELEVFQKEKHLSGFEFPGEARASLIPLGTERASFFYGLTMLMALALLILIVTH